VFSRDLMIFIINDHMVNVLFYFHRFLYHAAASSFGLQSTSLCKFGYNTWVSVLIFVS
jgi:hypothetical protein